MLCSKRHFDRYDPRLSAVTVFRFHSENANVPIMCLQCDDPACVKVCPTEALTISPAHVVTINEKRCIGCKFCVQACPTGTVLHSPENNVVLKCDLCGGSPLCAAWCPTKAIVYDDKPSGAGRRIDAANALRHAEQPPAQKPCTTASMKPSA
jgi:Fe-S-cluster-containing dehydrogenase component